MKVVPGATGQPLLHKNARCFADHIRFSSGVNLWLQLPQTGLDAQTASIICFSGAAQAVAQVEAAVAQVESTVSDIFGFMASSTLLFKYFFEINFLQSSYTFSFYLFLPFQRRCPVLPVQHGFIAGLRRGTTPHQRRHFLHTLFF